MVLGEVDLAPDELLDYGTLRAEGGGFVRGRVVDGDGMRVDLDDPHAFDLQPIAGGPRTPFAVREGIAVGPELARGRYRLLASGRSPFGYSFEGEVLAVADGADTESVFVLRDAREASLGLRIEGEHRTRAWWSYRLLEGGGRGLSTGQIRIVRRPVPGVTLRMIYDDALRTADRLQVRAGDRVVLDVVLAESAQRAVALGCSHGVVRMPD